MADGDERIVAGVPGTILSGRRWTKAREAIFFEELAATANVAHAARTAGMGKCGAYQRKQRDPQFAAAWRQALDVGFAELEMQLLRHSLEGSARTETVIDGASGAVKLVKTVHSFPHAIAFRVLLAHRDEVERFRQFEAARTGNDDDTATLVRAEMAKIRARLSANRREANRREDGDGGSI